MLVISLLGQLFVTLDDEPVTGFVSRKAAALLAYLVVESERPHGRPPLAEMFWPDQPASVARKNLRDILFNLQKVLGNRDAEPLYLSVTRNLVQFNRSSNYWLDAERFAALTAACETHRHKWRETCQSCAGRMQQAVALYRGDFLAGTFIGGSAPFENWLTLNRERLHQQVLEELYHLTRYHARRREFSQARQAAQRQLMLAPWLESAYQQLMALSAWEGQRGAALAQYELCRQRLATELAVDPGPETTALYEQIKAGHAAAREIVVSSLLSPLSPRHNIPVQTTPFYGREQVRRQLADYLQDPQRRLLTLTGPGGSGKTRLALQVMTEALYNFEDGVFFVPLAALDDPDHLPPALAAALGLPLAGAKPAQEQLLNYVREKELLLVLDNFEGLLGDGRSPAALDLLVGLLQKAPGVVLLATSRQPVGLQAEQLIDLDGLEFPSAESEDDPAQYDAVKLFLDRARRVQPKLDAGPKTLAATAAICRLTAGLPLGIELAAAWARQMTAADILQAIQSSLDALTTARRDVPARHRSLRATFEYSWRLLLPEEQRAFVKLSVFRGGFTVEAAGVPAPILGALVDKSLLQRDGDGRYQMHELLRQYAEAKLRALPDLETAVHDRHCAWVTDFLQQWGTRLKGGRQLEALARIGAEIDNIRAGWQWAVLGRKEAEISRTMRTIALFFDIRGWFQDESMFARAAGAMNGTGVAYGRLLGYQSAFIHRSGRYELAQKLFEESLALFEKLNTPAETAFPLNGLAAIAMSRGQFTQAKQHAGNGLTVAQKSGNQLEESKSLDILGVVARHEGRLAEAKSLLQASLRNPQTYWRPVWAGPELQSPGQLRRWGENV